MVCVITTAESRPFKTIQPGLQILFKIGGPKWPMERKMVGRFLK